jgi:hypothetical protein
VEKAALNQLENHAQNYNLIPIYQSAYRRYHSTETALLRLQYDMLKQMESRRVTAFIGLDLSAAFDTVDHSVLLSVLSERFGVTNDANSWIKSYLQPREFYVNVLGKSSSKKPLDFSVPQGSCLGPVLFTYYSSTIEEIVTRHEATICGYADDHGIFNSFVPDISEEQLTINSLKGCIDCVQTWMDANRLKMNPSKTEFIYFGTSQQLKKCNISSMTVENTAVTRTDKIKYLGFWIDENLTFKHQITQKIKTAMLNLVNIRSIRKYLHIDSCKVLVLNLVISHLDYANSLYYGLPACEIARLQRIQNAAAKLILGKGKFDSSTEALRCLHWLPVRYRINFKIGLLVFKCLSGTAPVYLSELLTVKCTRRVLRSSTSTEEAPLLVVPVHKNKTHLDRSFSFSGPTVWNSLPPDVRACDNIDLFKKKQKTYFFNKAFM